MIHRLVTHRLGLNIVLFGTTLFAVILPPSVSLEAAQAAQIADERRGQVANVGGDWQVVWTGRLGAEQCVLHLQQDGTKLTGTLKDLRGLSSLSGSIDEKQISFDVEFKGKYPFTTRFTGTVDAGKRDVKADNVKAGITKIEGTSQALGSGAYLGHAGEVTQPDHPWTATRIAGQTSHSPEASTTPNATAKN